MAEEVFQRIVLLSDESYRFNIYRHRLEKTQGERCCPSRVVGSGMIPNIPFSVSKGRTGEKSLNTPMKL